MVFWYFVRNSNKSLHRTQLGRHTVCGRWCSTNRAPAAAPVSSTVRVRSLRMTVTSAQYVFLIIMLGILGCSSSRVIQVRVTSTGTLYDERNTPLKYPGSSIQLMDGTILRADGIHLEGDSVFWTDSSSARSIHIDSLERIAGINRIYGGLEGIGIGFLVGAVPGAFIAGMIDQDDSEDGVPNEVKGLGVGAAVGSVVGLVVGTLIGHRYSIIFKRVQ